MIDVICGLMGSGKSTYARNNYRYVIERENFKSKAAQIRKAGQLHAAGKHIAYVTCYPTPEEIYFLGSLDPDEIEWYLMDTDIIQANKNIMKRGRKSDSDVIQKRFKKNRAIAERIARSRIRFHIIRVFDSGERW